MQRQNGELVLIDPLWAGSNPYMDALAQQRMEYYGNDFDREDEPLINGGELPKKKRIKKKKPVKFTSYNPNNDIPF